MPGRAYETVVEVAVRQHGLITTAQARERGVSRDALRMMAKRENLERVSLGLYRVPSLPYSEYTDYMEAVLWPYEKTGVISHESALSLYGLSDVSPEQVHITLPRDYRIRRRRVPTRFRVHHADLDPEEVDSFEGIPVTTPERALRECHEAKLGARLLRQALSEAEREGFISPGRAAELAEELLPPSGEE